MATHSSNFAWKIPEYRSQVGSSPWGHKESDTTEQLSTHTMISIAQHLFQMFVGNLYFFFSKKCPFKSFAYSFNQIIFFLFVVELQESLSMLDINPILDIWFTNIFSHFLSCLFTGGCFLGYVGALISDTVPLGCLYFCCLCHCSLFEGQVHNSPFSCSKELELNTDFMSVLHLLKGTIL